MSEDKSKNPDVAHTSIDEWLTQLASSDPAPGGGAVGALCVSLAASLVEMVCALTVGRPAYADHRQSHLRTMAETGRLRVEGLKAVSADAEAFERVIASYKLPKDTDNEKMERDVAIQGALIKAAQPPTETAKLAEQIIFLAKNILNNTNKSVISDIAVAAIIAKAALETSIVNVEVNIAAIKDPERREHARKQIESLQASIADADDLVTQVRSRINA